MRVVSLVLFASALAIEDFEQDALGAPGPTRGLRGLKFGHSATDLTDPPAPSPTSIPTPPAGGDFAETHDCDDCPDCVVPSDMNQKDFRDFPHDCVCFVDEWYGAYQSYAHNKFYGTDGDDCIAITGFYGGGYVEYFFVFGEGGDDVIVDATHSGFGKVNFYGGDGDDLCVGGAAHRECETSLDAASG